MFFRPQDGGVVTEFEVTIDYAETNNPIGELILSLSLLESGQDITVDNQTDPDPIIFMRDINSDDTGLLCIL